jgi:hypothetical protein
VICSPAVAIFSNGELATSALATSNAAPTFWQHASYTTATDGDVCVGGATTPITFTLCHRTTFVLATTYPILCTTALNTYLDQLQARHEDALEPNSTCLLVPLWNTGIQKHRNWKNIGLELAMNYNSTGI